MERLSLGQIGFENYKNLDDGQVRLEGLNLLIGPNGSGKSNLVQLLQFYQMALGGHHSEARRIDRLEDAILKLGGNYILDACLPTPARVQLGFSLHSANAAKVYRYAIDLLIQGAGKEVVPNEEPMLELTGLGAENAKALMSSLFAREGSAQYQTGENAETISSIRRTVVDAVVNWQFYNANQMSLETIRNAEPKVGPSDRFLSPSADNLPLVFDNLSQEHLDFEDTITAALREILPWTKKVRAVRSGRLGLVIEWSFEAPKSKVERFYLTEISDGSVRMLSWAIALLSPEPATLLVIEEPEIGIHVAWMPALANWIKSAAKSTQLIVSTHSPDLLDQFTDQTSNVLVFKQSTKRVNRFSIERLENKMIAAQFEKGWKLGDLYRVGDPSVGGWPW